MVGFLTDIGNYRSLNEDYGDYLIKDDYSVFVIADGMGGHNAGEVASKMAVDNILKFINENIDKYPKDKIIVRAIEEANRTIYEYSCENETMCGMGTTVAACIISKDLIYIANVGDSSCYLIENSGIRKITKDHSLVQQLLDEGSITEEEAMHHPNKNIITRAVGTNKQVEVDLYDLSYKSYKYIVLCTDGLSNEVEKEEIYNIVTTIKDVNEGCKELINLAKARGGKDNISVLIVGGEI